jgi:Rieske Fe-S protein
MIKRDDYDIDFNTNVAISPCQHFGCQVPVIPASVLGFQFFSKRNLLSCLT